EDGIRDFHVTGVQTCALPISTNVIRFDHKQYTTTDTVLIIVKPDSYISSLLTRFEPLLVNADTFKVEYYEIGSVEASSSVSYDLIINKILEQAKSHGAQALINLEKYEAGYYNPSYGWIEEPTIKGIMIRFKN